MNSQSITLCVALLSPASLLFSNAEDMDSADSVIELTPYTVTEGRVPASLERTSPSVSFVDSEEIMLRQYGDLTQLLNRLPGVEIVQNSGPGTLSSLFVRGTESDQTVIALNGRRLPGTLSGQYNLAGLFAGNVASVELLRGPSSSLWGSDAIGGVLNLRTLDADAIVEDTAHLSAETGTHEHFKTQLNASGKRKDLSASLGLTYLKTDGDRENEDHRNFQVIPSLHYAITETLSLDVTSFAAKTSIGVPGSENSFAFPSTEKDSVTTYLISPGLVWANDDMDGMLYYLHSDDLFEVRGTTGFPLDNDAQSTVDEINFQQNYKIGDDWLLSGGAGWSNTQFELEPGVGSFAAAYQNSYTNYNLWGQAQWTWNERLQITGSLRHDFYSDFEDPFTGTIRASWSVPEIHSTLFAKYGTSFKVPTPNDIRFAVPGLEPEEGNAWEVGIKTHCLEETLATSVVFFYGETDNLIVTDINTFSTDNLAESERYGVELSVDWQANAWLALYGNYTFLESETMGNAFGGIRDGAILIRRPRHKFTIGADTVFFEGLNVGVSFTSGIGRTDISGFPEQIVDVEDYHLARVYASYDLDEHITLFGRGENVLGNDYDGTIGFSAPRSQFFVGVRLRWE